MRRTIPALLALTTIVGLAAPAHAAEETEAPAHQGTTIDLSCEATTTDAGKPAISCDWDAVDGAAAYRVLATTRDGHRFVSVVRRTEETSFTRRARPGTYRISVLAADGEHKALGRSKRVKVTVDEPASSENTPPHGTPAPAGGA